MNKRKVDKIVNLTKKIHELKQEEKNLEKLIETEDNLNDILAELFSNESEEEIQEALKIVIENKNVAIVNTLLEQINLEIETLTFTDEENDKEKEFESIMLLLPCVVVGNENKKIKSINEIETAIQDKLIEKGVIKNRSNFKLATKAHDFEETKNYTMSQWWKIHRNIILEENKENVRIERNKKISLNTGRVISGLIFQFVFVEEIKEESDIDLEKFHEDDIKEIWTELSRDLSEENQNLLFLEPGFLEEITETTYQIIEDIEFDVFFNKVGQEQNISIAYAKTKENKNNYVIMFFDEESWLLSNYYIYETTDKLDFITLLINRLMVNNKEYLYRIEEEIEEETLLQWSESKWDSDIYDLSKKAIKLDLIETKKIIDPYYINEENPIYH